jgi:hypothetical protein
VSAGGCSRPHSNQTEPPASRLHNPTLSRKWLAFLRQRLVEQVR